MLETTANTLGIQHVPTDSVQHATALNGWVFFGTGNQSLGQGLMPFSVAPPNEVSAAAVAAIHAAHHQNMDYNTVMAGSTSITSKYAQKLKLSKRYVPANFEERLVCHQCFDGQFVLVDVRILGALLGTEHPNIHNHKLAVKTLVANQTFLKKFVNAEFGSKLDAAKIVYCFQLRHGSGLGNNGA